MTPNIKDPKLEAKKKATGGNLTMASTVKITITNRQSLQTQMFHGHFSI
jgi:hypothetical protein